MALAFVVNIPFLFNNLIYFISERFSPKTREIGSFDNKIVRLMAEPWELAGLAPVSLKYTAHVYEIYGRCKWEYDILKKAAFYIYPRFSV